MFDQHTPPHETHHTDVAVIGGGMAGVSAACAAAREGASVTLVERFAVTGGNATVGGVGNWSGETRGQGAIFDEILAMQTEWNAVAEYPGPYRHFERMNRVFDHEVLAVILRELLDRYGVTCLLHTRFVNAAAEPADGGRRRVVEVALAGASGPATLRANVFIDCTGDGQLARSAGMETMKGRASDGRQIAPSMMFFVRETDEPPDPQLPDGWFNPIRRAEDLPMVSVWPNGPGSKAIKMKVSGFDSTDTLQLAELEATARRRMWEVLDYYQRVERKCWRLDHCSPIIGLREGRRIVGDCVLSVDDLRAGRRFDDAVARGVFMLDAISPDDDKRTYLLSKDEQRVPPYQIPLRCLIARDGANLLTAGRSISADQLALSSARVMTTCSMTGQAAGVLAARAAGTGDVRSVDPAAVRARVEECGANLDV